MRMNRRAAGQEPKGNKDERGKNSNSEPKEEQPKRFNQTQYARLMEWLKNGPSWIRTSDQWIMSPLL